MSIAFLDPFTEMVKRQFSLMVFGDAVKDISEPDEEKDTPELLRDKRFSHCAYFGTERFKGELYEPLAQKIHDYLVVERGRGEVWEELQGIVISLSSAEAEEREMTAGEREMTTSFHICLHISSYITLLFREMYDTDEKLEVFDDKNLVEAWRELVTEALADVPIPEWTEAPYDQLWYATPFTARLVQLHQVWRDVRKEFFP